MRVFLDAYRETKEYMNSSIQKNTVFCFLLNLGDRFFFWAFGVLIPNIRCMGLAS